MAIREPARRCPRCGSHDLREHARAEAGEVCTIGQDGTLCKCRACGHEWVSKMIGGPESEVVYLTSPGNLATSFFGPVADLYKIVYAEPPYDEGPEQVARFRDGLPGEAERRGFTLVAAVELGLLAGAAYGWTMPSGTWWQRADREPPAALRDVEKFAVMEWIVHPDRRGQGIGAELMHRLLADRPEPYATLASDPRSTARKIYARSGWRQVGRSVLPWGPSMDLLVVPLSGGGTLSRVTGCRSPG
ncbi:GNAT family N-acetyltransferase [Micromonospora sp. NPDC051296]|uniref:GNAT family N-acetyltransferase n=1 Tax=Micromonospora sp. NPDC051296 TaxID=3155046 RepID=UPI0034421D6C